MSLLHLPKHIVCCLMWLNLNVFIYIFYLLVFWSQLYMRAADIALREKRVRLPGRVEWCHGPALCCARSLDVCIFVNGPLRASQVRKLRFAHTVRLYAFFNYPTAMRLRRVLELDNDKCDIIYVNFIYNTRRDLVVWRAKHFCDTQRKQNQS